MIGNFDFIQLHGSESRERVTEIKSMGFKIIKAIKVSEEKNISKYKEFDNADIILFDPKRKIKLSSEVIKIESKNFTYENKPAFGKSYSTMVDGTIICKNGKFSI